MRLRYPERMAYHCSDGWFWIAASRDILEPMTDDEIAVVSAKRRAGLRPTKGER